MPASKFKESPGYQIICNWMDALGQEPFSFQSQTWERFHNGYSGMVIAPTGFGKTFSVFIGVLIHFMNNPDKHKPGLQLLWITPLRSLAKDLARAMQEAIDQIGLDWTVEVRNGDTDIKIKQRQSKRMPEVLLVTPESFHLLLAQKGRKNFFENIQCIAIDEWHELLGTKRGVMIELALQYVKLFQPKVKIWGITATIGNLEEALEVILPNHKKRTTVIAKERKQIEIIPVYPDEVEVLPWAGHLGSQMADKVVPIILESKSTIVFTNTRNQSESWYQLLLQAYPDFAGQLALHHSSIDAPIRQWIEEALSDGKLKAVVSTSSLDLGVDFKPVDTVIQIGSSKGVARFMQRAGRSGHSPFEISKIFFVPTHSLELIEVAALKEAVKTNTIENKQPLIQCYDVLVQFLVTIALGGGFYPNEIYPYIKNTYAFQDLNEEEWQWCLLFITQGGSIGKNYEEFHKVKTVADGLMVVENRRIGMLHRMNLGVIVSEAMLKVKFQSGGFIGMVEEYFITKLKPGDKFILAGRVLEYLRIKDMTVHVKNSTGKAITPSWLGGRLPLTSNLSHFLRAKLAKAMHPNSSEEELNFLHPLVSKQVQHSHIPAVDEFLVEHIKTKEGYHLFFYPFEGRLVHEVMAALMAFRISRLYPISFSMAMNDYGFELFSDSEISISEDQLELLLSKDNLMQDVVASINAAEMAKRKFRDIAVIAGMVLQNVYGKQRNNKSLQSSAGLLFNVLEEYEPNNLLIRQAYDEVFHQQLEEPRLRAAFERINQSKIIYTFATKFTPLSFPIKVDSLRQSLSSEDLAKRIEKMQTQAAKNRT
jgi:ATP-dependent Lhr-like helicase